VREGHLPPQLVLDLFEERPGRVLLRDHAHGERPAQLERGVVVRASGQKIVMSPPLVIEDEQADRVVATLLDSLGEL